MLEQAGAKGAYRALRLADLTDATSLPGKGEYGGMVRHLGPHDMFADTQLHHFFGSSTGKRILQPPLRNIGVLQQSRSERLRCFRTRPHLPE